MKKDSDRLGVKYFQLAPSFEFETIINFLKIPIIPEKGDVDPEPFLVQRVDRQIFWNLKLNKIYINYF